MSAIKKFNFKPLVNVRMQKDETSSQVFTTSVKGGFRFPPKAAAILGIKDYSAVTVFSDEDEDTGEVTTYVAKGHAGTIKRDENGEIVTGSRNTTEFEDNDPMDGAIVRESSEGSKILSVNSAAAWKTIGGAKDKELCMDLVSIGVMEYPLPSGVFVEGEVFQLVVTKIRPINARKKSKGVDADDSDDEEVEEAIAGEDFEEEEA
jgi:hypothetical protein